MEGEMRSLVSRLADQSWMLEVEMTGVLASPWPERRNLSGSAWTNPEGDIVPSLPYIHSYTTVTSEDSTPIIIDRVGTSVAIYPGQLEKFYKNLLNIEIFHQKHSKKAKFHQIKILKINFSVDKTVCSSSRVSLDSEQYSLVNCEVVQQSDIIFITFYVSGEDSIIGGVTTKREYDDYLQLDSPGYLLDRWSFAS